MHFIEDLKALEKNGKYIRVGLVGAGFMGKGIVEVMESVPGMKVVAIADLDMELAFSCFKRAGYTAVHEVKRAEESSRIDFSKERAVTSSHRTLAGLPGLDFVIEATGDPEVGAEVAFLSIMNKKHAGMLNVETDVTVGPYLSRLARSSNLVYTVCTGDEPAAVKELVDFALSCGFSIVACGKGKNNPLDVEATPASLSAKAREMGLNPRMLTEFVDGSKTMVEMGCVANALGLTIDRRSMHGPRAKVDELTRVFRAKERGGILSREGVVDYAVGDVAPGVFTVVRHEKEVVADTLRYLKIGEGPEFLLYRPYHLTNIEVPVSVAQAFLYGKPSIAALSAPATEVIAIAKKNLKRGDFIDYIGGSTVYGGLEIYERSREHRLLPLGLCAGAELLEDVPKGSAIMEGQVELKESLLLNLRRAQERLYD